MYVSKRLWCVCVLTAQTQQDSQTRAFLWASRCFALTLPYLIKRDGSGPWGQSGTHTHAKIHAHTHAHILTSMHTHSAPHPNATTTKSYIHAEHRKIHMHKHRNAGEVVVFRLVFFFCTLTYREKCLGHKCVSLNATENYSHRKGRGPSNTHSQREEEKVK